jgi:hypothetical protein
MLKKYITQQQLRGETLVLPIDEEFEFENKKKKYEEMIKSSNACAQRVGVAQHEMDGMHVKLDKAVRDINRCNEDCKIIKYINIHLFLVDKTKDHAQGLTDFMVNDRFSALEFEKNLDRNLK